MPDNLLPSYVLKLFRASEQYRLIAKDFAFFVESELDISVETEFDGTDEWEVARWTVGADVPAIIGVYLGEFAYNVRSALDHLIYDLIITNSEDPGEHTQFPIYDSEVLWDRDIVARDPDRKPSPVRGLTPDQLAVIEKAQPYHVAPKKRPRHPLMQLLRISNVDKHQSLHTAMVKAGKPDFVRFEPSGYKAIVKKKIVKTGTMVNSGAEIARVKSRWIREPPTDTKVQMRASGPAELVFSEKGKPPIASVNDLRLIHEVAKRIIGKLRPTDELLGSLQDDLELPPL